uniref:DUF19 domain-containing protein n=1 Tax=Caenorhabditis tropicalis TaxID=1561998 RepID=A0A1I7UWD3_9PELO
MNIVVFVFLCFILKVESKVLGYDPKKETCGVFGNFHISYCEIRYDLVSAWRKNSIWWTPEQTLNMTLAELKEPCDNSFVCKENSGCFQDFVNFQYLDECIDDMFELGPMELCEQKLREVMKKKPDEVADCVKKHFENKDPEKFDCVSIKEKGECFLPDVEKHCDKSFLKVYKEHQDLRLFNRACDGRLRYKDWDYKGSQDVAIQSVPGGIKVADPKRNSTGELNSSESSYFSFVLLGFIFNWLFYH